MHSLIREMSKRKTHTVSETENIFEYEAAKASGMTQYMHHAMDILIKEKQLNESEGQTLEQQQLHKFAIQQLIVSRTDST